MLVLIVGIAWVARLGAQLPAQHLTKHMAVVLAHVGAS